LEEEKTRGQIFKAGGAGGCQGPLWGPGATPWWGIRGQSPFELLDFSIFKHSRRDLQGVIILENEMEESEFFN
jgi:hypothetical protein